MRQIVLWTSIVYWFIHLGIGTGVGYGILRLWPNRHNPFVWRVAIYMHAAIIDVLVSIVLVFMSKGVKLTYKFWIAWLVSSILMDAVRIPLIIYVIKGNGKARGAQQQTGSVVTDKENHE